MVDPIAASIEILAFDVFGTVVDWRSSVTGEPKNSADQKGLALMARHSPTHGAQLTDHHWIACNRARYRGPSLTLFIACLWIIS